MKTLSFAVSLTSSILCSSCDGSDAQKKLPVIMWAVVKSVEPAIDTVNMPGDRR